jgi:hypothetical protein
MQKGKFGFALWLYPFIALWTVLLWEPFASIAIMLFVIGVEKDEWAIKQCIHVVMFNIYWSIYLYIMDLLTSLDLIGIVFSIIALVIWIIMMILTLLLGILRLRFGHDILLPGKGIVNRAFGLVQSFQQNYGQPQYGAAPQYQPYPPQNAPAAPGYPPQPPQYAPQQPPQFTAAPTPPPTSAAPQQTQAAPPPPPAFGGQTPPSGAGGQTPPPPPPKF